MGQTREAITQSLVECLCWQAAQRDDAHVARCLYRRELVDDVYRLDEGALLDDFFHFLRELGILGLMERVQGTALQREMVPVVQYLLLYGLKTLFGIERMNALPGLLFSDEALMQWWVLMPNRCGMGSASMDKVSNQPRIEPLIDGIPAKVLIADVKLANMNYKIYIPQILMLRLL
jgi:hypothetical protein